MSDPLSLEDLRARLREFRDARDWAQFHTLKDLAIAISVEAAELQEIFLWSRPEEERALLDRERATIEHELADVVIQCLNFADVSHIDVLAAIEAKIEFNASRYPVEKAKGTAAKHTEL